jgi:2-hydroxy-3-oxopropionate reductase
MTDKVGFIGTGIMGLPMALNVIHAGYPLWVFARTKEKVLPLIQAGAILCESPRQVTDHADVIITVVGDTPDVEQIVLGDQGVIEAAAPGKVLVDMTTSSASSARNLAKRLSERGMDMLDAPVSGGDIGAREGTLSIMVGGTPAVFDRVKALFEAMGEKIVLVGDHGAGQVAKACNQLLVAQHIAATAEALLLAKGAGVDPGRVREALLGGFAASRVLEFHGQRMLDRNFVPGFKAKLHKKDMRIALETMRDCHLDLPSTQLAAEGIDRTVDSGYGELDTTAVLQVLEAQNHLKLS